MAKEWRLDKVLRRLEAMLIVADQEHLLVLSGSGGDQRIGGGGHRFRGPYALAAAGLC